MTESRLPSNTPLVLWICAAVAAVLHFAVLGQLSLMPSTASDSRMGLRDAALYWNGQNSQLDINLPCATAASRPGLTSSRAPFGSPLNLPSPINRVCTPRVKSDI